MSNIIFEVCAGSYEDVVNASDGGASRIELNSALYLGGLTPSLAEFNLSYAYTKLPIIVMIRPRPAGFYYNQYEFNTMYEDAKILINHGAAGIAFGCLNLDCSIDIAKCQSLVKLAHDNNREAVFHRAFDLIPNQLEAIHQLIDLGFDRVLTSCGATSAPLVPNSFIDLIKASKGSIDILAGCGFNKDNIKEFITKTNIKEIHASAKTYKLDPTTSNSNVSYSYSNIQDSYEICSLSNIKEITKLLKTIK
ncbi:MAG: copper homeostasis protein CutC [Erysipelotrichaceae bacterium]